MEKDGINVHFQWSLLGLLGEVASRSVLQTELITFSPIQSRWWSGGHLLCHPASMDPNYVFLRALEPKQINGVTGPSTLGFR